MAFDGIVIANLVRDLKKTLLNGRIVKISQPEKDELLLTVKNYNQFKLFISAEAGLPLIYITEKTKVAPLTAPNFCMLLRKHLTGAKILDIEQPGMERVIRFKLENLDDMGDLCIKFLIVEIMGKHSNIIFCDENNKIIDSIKHISGLVSSVREVLPGRDYFIPQTMDKHNPFETDYMVFKMSVLKQPMMVGKAIYMSLTGFSPLMANEICCRAGIDSTDSTEVLTEDIGLHLYNTFNRFMEDIKEDRYEPNIIYKGKTPIEFSSVRLTCYEKSEEYETVKLESISEVLEKFYAERNTVSRIRQKSVDLRKIVMNAIERASKKYNLQIKQLEDTEKRDKYRVYGELLTTYGYAVASGEKSTTVLNYYTGENIIIPLDEQISAIDNAKVYFEKYSKLKRTWEALSKLIIETKEELEHLDSIKTALDISIMEEDLIELKEELIEFGYMKRHSVLNKNGKAVGKGKAAQNRRIKITSKPYHYLSSEGFNIYVGKNNYQNDDLTFKTASGNDWWFHAKGIPGSHVILKTEGKEIPDSVFEKAASLAAYYSKGRDSEKVEIDYLEKKNVKKPNGAKPGFVVYYTNYSMIAVPSLEGLIVDETK